MAFPDTSRMQCLPWDMNLQEMYHLKKHKLIISKLHYAVCIWCKSKWWPKQHQVKAVQCTMHRTGLTLQESNFTYTFTFLLPCGTANITYTSKDSHPFSHIFHRLDTRSIQIIIVLSRLNKLVLLDVLLHLLSGHHKVVVSPIHLIVPLRPSGIFGTRIYLLDIF